MVRLLTKIQNCFLCHWLITIETKSFSLLTEPLAFTFALDDPKDFAGFLLVGVLFNLSTTNLVNFSLLLSIHTENCNLFSRIS